MDAEAYLTTTRLPVFTLTICLVSVCIFSVPELRAFLIYDRAAITHGELWRLVTGNLTHLSNMQLCLDLSAFFVAGMIIEIRGYRHFPLLCLLAAALIGIVLYYMKPAMYYYAGLSGVVSAAVTYLCLYGLKEKGTWRWLCAVVLTGMTAKIGMELFFDKSLMSEIGTKQFVPVPFSHLVGSVTALLLYFGTAFVKSDRQQ